MKAIGGAPHELLFPRCAVAIIHGGAGTTAAVLRAGIPCVIFHVLGDQGFWGARCAALGVGPKVTTLAFFLIVSTLCWAVVCLFVFGVFAASHSMCCTTKSALCRAGRGTQCQLLITSDMFDPQLGFGCFFHSMNFSLFFCFFLSFDI